MVYNDEFLRRLTHGLQAALPAWGLGGAQLTLLTISENATFLAHEPSGEKTILRVHRPHYHTEAEIRAELAWVQALAADNIIHTPAPLAALDGRALVEFFDGETTRLAAAFAFMQGSEPDAQGDLPFWYGKLGEITARLHLHARRWQKPETFTRKDWVFDTIIGTRAHWGDWRTAPGLSPDGTAILNRVSALLARQTAAYGHAPERFGLVHCDLRTANLLADGERLAIIDFDDCGLSWYMYDFATAISFMEHEPVIPALCAAWVQGYRRAAPLSAEDEAALPMFTMLRRIQLTAWVATHAETPTAQTMGETYVRGTVALGAAYLQHHALEAVP